jgi:uncharacterized protein YyaL (SSP411 family)
MLSERLIFGSGILMLLLAGCAKAGDQDRPKDAQVRRPNRLAQESSPYLLQHAHNPVDWFPWGTEAFTKAKKEGKLVFLSIGYSSCHWCHVMERESFDNPEVAKLLNDWFVCIKVDREERPDIDSIYMTALNVHGQRGGWPLSMFLTADGKPIAGGTYWPPEDRAIAGDTIPGFKSVLKTMHEWQTTKADRLQAQADRVATATRAALTDLAGRTALVDLDRKLVQSTLDDIKDEFDAEYGGFGTRRAQFRGPKFPVPPYLGLLLHEAGKSRSPELLNMVTTTLDHMAQGGIYDQLGGGFHRYSTERTWTVPHFEKMLYDNAQLAEVYAQAFRLTRKPLYRQVVQETLAFVTREMTSPEGAFYSALDADSTGGEGFFYVWTDAEIAEALSDKADVALVKKVYGADGQPNFEGKAHIFVRTKPLADVARELKLTEDQLQARLTPLKQKLFDRRAPRPRPFLDTKVLTGWNGQMIAGYAVAGQALGEPKYVEAAARAADFVLKHLRTPDGRLLRTYGTRPGQGGSARLNAYLDDYAYLTHGLLCLHDATRGSKWLDEAKALTDTMVKFHGDPESGGFFYTSSDHEKLFARAKDQHDGAQPSGNSVAARNLVRLSVKTGEAQYRERAQKTIKAFATALKSNGTSLTGMAEALALYLDGQDKSASTTLPRKDLLVQAGGPKKSDAVVKVTAKAEPAKPGADGKQTVTITLEIDKGWHIYANPPGLDDLASSQTEVSISSEKKLKDVKIEYPEGKEVKDSVIGNYKVYDDEVSIKATIERTAADSGALEVTMKFQACNEKHCLLPATKTLKVP